MQGVFKRESSNKQRFRGFCGVGKTSVILLINQSLFSARRMKSWASFTGKIKEILPSGVNNRWAARSKSSWEWVVQ